MKSLQYNSALIAVRPSDNLVCLTDMWKAEGCIWKALPSVSFDDLKSLPQISGIYFAASDKLLYIGRSINILERWERHHRKPYLSKIPEVRIYWFEIKDISHLAEIETSLIKELQPELNNKYCKTVASPNPAVAYSQKLCDMMQKQERSFYQVLDVFHLRLQARGRHYASKAQVKKRLLGIMEARLKPTLQEFTDICCAILQDCDISKNEEWALGAIVERIEEDADPELGITRSRDRAIARWKKQGKSDQWIASRLKHIDIRCDLTDTLQDHGVNLPWQFGVCTNEIYKPVLGAEAKEAKVNRNLPAKSNLRDSLDDIESTAIALAEALTRKKISTQGIEGFKACRDACRQSGEQVSRVFQEVDS